MVVGYGIKFFWPGLFITSPDHLDCTIWTILNFDIPDDGVNSDIEGLDEDSDLLTVYQFSKQIKLYLFSDQLETS